MFTTKNVGTGTTAIILNGIQVGEVRLLKTGNSELRIHGMCWNPDGSANPVSGHSCREFTDRSTALVTAGAVIDRFVDVIRARA